MQSGGSSGTSPSSSISDVLGRSPVALGAQVDSNSENNFKAFVSTSAKVGFDFSQDEDSEEQKVESETSAPESETGSTTSEKAEYENIYSDDVQSNVQSESVDEGKLWVMLRRELGKYPHILASCAAIELNPNFLWCHDDYLLDLVVNMEKVDEMWREGKLALSTFNDGRVEPNLALEANLLSAANHNPAKKALVISHADLSYFENQPYYQNLCESSPAYGYAVRISGLCYPAVDNGYASELLPDWNIRVLAISVSSVTGQLELFQSATVNEEIYNVEQILNWECLHTERNQVRHT